MLLLFSVADPGGDQAADTFYSIWNIFLLSFLCNASSASDATCIIGLLPPAKVLESPYCKR